jgi:hypothetical protein
MPARNNRGGVTICDAYSRCYVAPAAYACAYAVTSRNNRRGVASGVLCGSAPMLYDLTDRVLLRDGIGQCEARRIICKRLKLVGGQAYDR